MTLHAILNVSDFQAAAHRIDFLWDALPGSPEEEELQLLVALTETWAHQASPAPAGPVAALPGAERPSPVPEDLDPDLFLLELGRRILGHSA